MGKNLLQDNSNNLDLKEIEILVKTDDLLVKTNDEDLTQTNAGEDFRCALKSRLYLLTLLACGCIWSYNNFVGIGITFSYETLAGSRLLNFFLLNIVALPAKLIGITLCRCVRRRLHMSAFYTVIGFLHLLIVAFRCVVGDIDVGESNSQADRVKR
jgi:hypothetical protein